MTSNCGFTTCPICKGSGKLAEDPTEYMFETRDPKTSKCLICNGSGKLHNRKRLPDGRSAGEINKQNSEMSKWEEERTAKIKKTRTQRLATARPIYIIVVQKAAEVASIIKSIEGGENA